MGWSLHFLDTEPSLSLPRQLVPRPMPFSSNPHCRRVRLSEDCSLTTSRGVPLGLSVWLLRQWSLLWELQGHLYSAGSCRWNPARGSAKLSLASRTTGCPLLATSFATREGAAIKECRNRRPYSIPKVNVSPSTTICVTYISLYI